MMACEPEEGLRPKKGPEFPGQDTEILSTDLVGLSPCPALVVASPIPCTNQPSVKCPHRRSEIMLSAHSLRLIFNL